MEIATHIEGIALEQTKTLKEKRCANNIGKTRVRAPRQGTNIQLDDALFGDIDPKTTRKKEQACFRGMANMSIAGYTQREIATAFGRTEGNVSEILRQPFMREYMIEQQQEGAEDFRESIKAMGQAALLRVVSVSETATQEAVKLKANEYIVNRWLGMPTQPIEEVTKPVEKRTDEELLSAVGNLLNERALALDPT